MNLGPPPPTDFAVDITGEDVALFAETGHLTVERITTDEELEWFRSAFDEFESMPRSGFPDTVFDVARPYGSTDEPDLGQLLFPERRMQGVHDTAMWRNGKRIAARLLDVDEATVESWGHLIFKPPGHGGETSWHQDEAYWEAHLAYHAVGGVVERARVVEADGTGLQTAPVELETPAERPWVPEGRQALVDTLAQRA